MITLNNLSKDERSKLFEGMQKTEKGKKRLNGWRKARKLFPSVLKLQGRGFRITERDYKEYLRGIK